MSVVLIGGGAPSELEDFISRSGSDVVRLPSFYPLDPPVSDHPDILCFPLNGKIVTAEKYYEQNKALFGRFSDAVVRVGDCPFSPYPNDVCFDALPVGDKLIGHVRHISGFLKGMFEILHVNQGYARCSVAALSDDAFITSDTAIAGVLRSLGKDVLEITPGNIELDGCSYGFIGGAGGLLPDGTYLFFGDPETHPDGGKMLAFAGKHKIKTAALRGRLRDCGGLACISCSL